MPIREPLNYLQDDLWLITNKLLFHWPSSIFHNIIHGTNNLLYKNNDIHFGTMYSLTWVAQAGLKLLLHWPPRSWDHRHVPTHALTLISIPNNFSQ